MARSGPEYDRLIEVKQVAANKFRAKVQRAAGGLVFGATIRVAYSNNNNAVRNGEYYKDLYPREGKVNYLASFELVTIEGYTPYIEVFWFPEKPGMCGAFGESGDLIVE